MDNLSEMLKGVLEGVMLEIIDHEEVYGYEIVKKLHELGFKDISEGTVYTVLTRIERKRLVTSSRRSSELGPPRKFYTLNARGKVELTAFWQRWAFLQSRLNDLKGSSNDQ